MSRRRRYVWVLVGVLVVADASCARYVYRVVACHWLELEDAPGLEVTSVRVTGAPWRECSNVNAPGYYRLPRDAYTVEFWNGDRGDHPEFYLSLTSAYWCGLLDPVSPRSCAGRVDSPAFIRIGNAILTFSSVTHD